MKPIIFAISGVKNSGKTTLITKLIPEFARKGLQTAVIKHDGHEFCPGTQDNDTGKQYAAGALGTVVFSGSQYQLVKHQREPKPWDFYAAFPEADVILLEGFKHCYFPKLELIRSGNSEESICQGYRLLGIASDASVPNKPEIPDSKQQDHLNLKQPDHPNPKQSDHPNPPQPDYLDFNEPARIADWILEKAESFPSMIVLAGGRSRRMGRDKALLELHGQTFLECQIQKGRELGITELLVSGYHGPGEMLPAGSRIVPDQMQDRGPLGGMLASFKEASNRLCLVLPVDAPLLPLSLLAELLIAASKNPELPTILRANGREEPLIGVYPKSLVPEIQRELTEGKGSVISLLRRTGYEVLEVPEPAPCLLNINDPEAYRQVQEQSIMENKNI